MVLESNPDDLTHYQTQTKIGVVQELTDDLDGAMATYSRLERAKRFRRYQPKVRLKIANVYRLTDDTDGSLAAYKKIITDNPRTEESAESYYQIALIEHQIRRNNEAAMELLAKARKERSTSEAAAKARELETTLFQLNKFKKRAEKDNKQGNEALFSIAEIYLFSLGEVDSALSAYERVLARPDTNELTAKALYGMALIYADSLDNQVESTRLFQKLISDYPVTPYAIDARERVNEDRSDDILAEARYIEAEALKDEGADPQEVLTILNQVTEEYPASLYAPKALFAMAWTYENDLANPDVATKQYERLVETYPLTNFAEISKDKIKSIKKEQRDLQRKLAKEKKDAEATEATSKEEKEKKEEKLVDKPKIPDKSDQEKPSQPTERVSSEAESKDNKGDKPTPKPAKATQESAPKPKDGPLDAAEIDQLPALVHAPPPEHREELNEEEGMDPNVSVRTLVGKDGKIMRVIVVEGNEMLRKAAVDLAFQYRFEPGIHKGKPREVWMEFPITFLKPYSEEEGEPQ
jgi:outer membrane protein assembly factor BamD (BamD/ComL family)